MTTTRKLWVLIGCLAAVCLLGYAVSPRQRPDTKPLAWNAELEGYWGEMEGCLGLRGKPPALSVWTGSLPMADRYGNATGAQYDPDSHEIIFMPFLLAAPMEIRHEFAHALRGDRGHDHPMEVKQACGDLVKWP